MTELDIDKVSGSDCLDYINRKIGFAFHGSPTDPTNATIRQEISYATAELKKEDNRERIATFNTMRATSIIRWTHDTSKRKIGLVVGRSEEGGYEVALLGNEYMCNGGNPATTGSSDFFHIRIGCGLSMPYQFEDSHTYRRYYTPSLYPYCVQARVLSGSEGVPSYFGELYTRYLTFNETIDYIPAFEQFASVQPYPDVFRFANAVTTNNTYQLSNDKTNTMVFGHRITNCFTYPRDYMKNPLAYCSGNLYQWACDYAYYFEPKIPYEISDTLYPTFYADLDNEDFEVGNIGFNLTSVPYNIILTYDENQAKKYLQDGTLPSDAFLFPLDFENLPKYQSDETDDSDEDDGGDGDADDNGRDTDENLPQVPPYTPGALNNNNVYLLSRGELELIIRWMWNDVGALQDIDDLINKIEGITSDLTQNLLMVRVMPVKPDWIGGVGSPSNFILGQVEKSGSFTTLAKGNPTVENIGTWHFSEKFSSFKFLNFAPYSEFKLYLPYHGIVDLDVSVFQGHRLNVKAVYDYLTGTITYMLYCDNTWLVNTYTAKMAVDLAITLQTKADRDSAIFNNVSNAVAGVMTAGSSIAAGNPIGLVLGAQSLTQQGQSAPFKAMGQVGETGAFYAPQKCAVLVRRPVYRKPETYNSSVGRQSYKSYTLAKLKGKGYTKIINPRLEFTKTQPLAEEVQELNDILSSGVIL